MTNIWEMDKQEIMDLLTVSGNRQQELFEEARQVRAEATNNEVTIRGVIEISSYCQKPCGYCPMRVQNRNLDRYRMNADQILTLVEQIHSAGIPIAFLQGGQDPHCDAILEEVIPVIKGEFGMEVLLCVGERKKEVYEKWVELGADSFILKFEIANPELHKQIIGRPIETRLPCLDWIREAGMRLGTGNIVGLPEQTLEHLAEDVQLALKIKPDFISSSPFIPGIDTPFQMSDNGNLQMTLNSIAMWRIAFRTCLTPTVSALEKLQAGGQLMGFHAGANVLTVNFTPKDFQDNYPIYTDKRFVVSLDHAFKTIEEAGLQIRQPIPHATDI